MLPFRLIYSDDYYLPIGAHVFPAEKYRRIHQRLLKTRVADPSDFLEPSPASDHPAGALPLKIKPPALTLPGQVSREVVHVSFSCVPALCLGGRPLRLSPLELGS